MAKDLPRLTTTSYAILGLLRLHEWTAYELAQQMQRSTFWIWPRAESGVYEEPKKLIAHGYTSSRDVATGRRKPRCYRVTAAGRRAMSEWLGQTDSSASPRLESEDLVRVWFPEQGDQASLLSAIERFREHINAQLAQVLDQVETYTTLDAGPFPTRRHVHLLTARLILDHVLALRRWCDWAEEQVRAWPEISGDDRSFVTDELKRLAADIAKTRRRWAIPAS